MLHRLFFLFFPLIISAQQRDSIPLPDTTYLMDQIYRVNDGKKSSWGFYENDSKKWITEPVYDSILHRYNAVLKLSFYEIRKADKWGFLNKDLSVWIPAEYDKLDYGYELNPDRIFVRKGDKYGILKKDGSFWIDLIYEEIETNGFEFKVKRNGKWGLLNKDAKEIIPVCYDRIFENATPQFSLVQNGTVYWSLFQWVQNSADPCKPNEKYQFERIEYFNEYFTVFKNGKWGMLDAEGNVVLKIEYEDLKPFVASYLRTLKVKQNGKYGLIQIDSVGTPKKAADIVYDDIGIDDESYKIRVAQGEMKDYLYEGKPYFGLIYNDVLYFTKYRQFAIKSGKKWGIAAEDKRIIIKPNYDKIMFIDTKTYMVKKSGKWGIINNFDQVMIPIDYSEFDFRPDGYFFAAKNGKWGVVSLKQGVLLPSKYDDLMVLPNKTFLVQRKGKIGVVGAGDRVIVPIEYSDVNYKEGDSAVELKHQDGRKYKYRIK